MRFGYWRGVTLALALVSALATGFASNVSAQGIFHPTIPRETPAMNTATGEPMYAPPIPYGAYAKDHAGCIHGAVACLKCRLGGGLHRRKGLGNGCGQCGGAGCGSCGGGGLFQGHGHGDPCGNCGGIGCGLCAGGGGVVIPAKTLPSPQACDSCGGSGCDSCGGLGHAHGGGGLFHGQGDPCGNCGGKGCGRCGGAGGLHGRLSSILHPHAGRIKYFVGAGGPVPLTPGYVPYVVPTRSPRDFFAFPPYSPDVP